jgi:hypothetical protein
VRRLLVALVVLASCAHAAPPVPAGYCETPCGLRWKGDCTALAKTEKRVIAAYAKHAKEFGTREDICAAFAGYAVVVHRQDKTDKKKCGAGWLLGTFCASGYTHYAEHVIEIFDDDFESGALAHELGHVLSQKTAGGGHCAWQERGIKAAIKEVTGSSDKSPPESTCIGSRYVSPFGAPDAGT